MKYLHAQWMMYKDLMMIVGGTVRLFFIYLATIVHDNTV